MYGEGMRKTVARRKGEGKWKESSARENV